MHARACCMHGEQGHPVYASCLTPDVAGCPGPPLKQGDQTR